MAAPLLERAPLLIRVLKRAAVASASSANRYEQTHYDKGRTALRQPQPFVVDGREANREFWTGFFAALPDLSATMEDLVTAGDRVVGRFVYRGTHTESW